ncbi:uncharacterized protein FIESC28_10696 [Fusarium coffeatum]|uniref:Cutinase n=1 Tax=Fusarium coffeatum TaxID=231269 RepID=A0A366QR56_9HYPO|nr:uncharacterized protein FIESC28_10696 [Fusarium coffeatum]RBR07353.1 hypothetical protein FIESC28_10696 [Fusarium coffeatum]
MQQKSSLLFLLATAAAADAHSIGIRASECKDVHVFLAKGNNEPYPGRQGKLAEAICDGYKSCDYEDILFNNPLEAPFCDSVTEGVVNGKKQITAYNKRCPKSKLVVSGYSQGGQVVGDILGGGGGVFFEDCVEDKIAGLSSKSEPGSSIVAAMIFGDTRHTAGQPYNVLTGADSNGLFPRPADQLANLASYGDVLQAYCVKTDPICAQGKDVKTHLNYFDVFTDEVADWVKERVKKAGGAAEGTAESSSTAVASTTKAKVSTTQETTITTTMASETEATTMVVSKTIVSEAEDTASTATGLPSEVVTSLVEAASSAGQAAAAGASSTSTDNAAAPTGAPVVGIMIGVAALLAI